MPADLFANRPLDALSPELLRAARWVEQNAREVALQSMRECARRAGLAPATFTRMAHALGFAGFAAVKRACQDSLARPSAFAERARRLQASASREADWMESLSAAQHANSASIGDMNDRLAITRAADAMRDAVQVVFLGLRACHGLAFHLNYTYGLIAANGVLAQGLGGTLADQLGQLGKGHLLVALSLSPYTRQTVEAVQAAHDQGAQVLAITDSRLSPIAAAADQLLLFRADSPSYFQSMVGGLALTETLVAAVAVRGGRAVLNRLQANQARLERQGAYWSKPRRAARPASPAPARSGT